MRAERRRRRWVLPVVLLAASGAVVAHRVRAAAVPQDAARPAVPPAPIVPPTRAAAPTPTVAPMPAEPADAPVGTAALNVPRRGVVTLVEPPTGVAPAAGGTGPLPARSDGSSPDPEYTIKGSGGSRVYHPPSSPYYGRTRAEVWFRTVEDAEAAGFRAHRSRRPD